MLDETQLSQLDASLKRVFAMKVSRSTFRELQNILIAITQGNKELANDLFEGLFTGKPKDSLLKTQELAHVFNEICQQFSVLVRLSKEVFERGEFVNIITSDMVSQGKEIAFLNRIKRIDGEEFLFISDPMGTMHLLRHFFGRIQELERSAEGREQLGASKSELLDLASKLHLIASK